MINVLMLYDLFGKYLPPQFFSFIETRTQYQETISPLMVSLQVCARFCILLYMLGFYFLHRNQEATIIGVELVLVSLYIHASFFIFFYTIFDTSKTFQATPERN